ncbi:MAG TPA: CapA family protein [Stellaceae bacterium]|nr:CapA family protein [Stellaceae bacterium]
MARTGDTVAIALTGDAMLGRGIDQILAHPSQPELYEPYISSAVSYVELAEQAHGVIPRRVDPTYVWGDALATLARLGPDLRIVNLETAISRSDEPAPKGINYRMHPGNIECLRAFAIDCCVLANNHVLDWDAAGLIETVETLEGAGIRFAGAGRNAAEARAPATLDIADKGRTVLFAFALDSAGVPSDWAARARTAGVNFLPKLSKETAAQIGAQLAAIRRSGDISIASLHWGPNWGYDISQEQRAFAYHLIDRGFDVIHGHSSHHAKAIEIHRGKLILYGCGDFINDYEGISGHDAFRDDLALVYLAEISCRDGRLRRLRLIPFQIERFCLKRAGASDVSWLAATLDRESRPFGTRVVVTGDMHLEVAAADPAPS